MGQVASYGLTQYDVEDVMNHCDDVFSQKEVEGLYRRFRTLDKGRKGYLSSAELMSIPELSINPIAQRLVRLFESVNFKEFVKLLAPFSKRASRDMKLAAMFHVYDIDGDGVISSDDMQLMLRQLGGSNLSDEEVASLVERTLREAGGPRGLDLEAYKRVLAVADLSHMAIEIPSEA